MLSKIRVPLAFVVTAIWFFVIFRYVVEPKGGMACLLAMDLNEIGDFFAGTFAPLAFFWFVIAYWQQSDELRHASKEMGRQADSVEENTRHAARDIFLRFADLTIADIQFKAVQEIITLNKIPDFVSYQGKISQSYKAYWAGDRDAPFRRLGLLIQKFPEEFKRANNSFPTVKKLSLRIVESYRKLLIEAEKSEKGEGVLLRFYEDGIYGDVIALICLALSVAPPFINRPAIKSVDEVII